MDPNTSCHRDWSYIDWALCILNVIQQYALVENSTWHTKKAYQLVQSLLHYGKNASWASHAGDVCLLYSWIHIVDEMDNFFDLDRPQKPVTLFSFPKQSTCCRIVYEGMKRKQSTMDRGACVICARWILFLMPALFKCDCKTSNFHNNKYPIARLTMSNFHNVHLTIRVIQRSLESSCIESVTLFERMGVSMS